MYLGQTNSNGIEVDLPESSQVSNNESGSKISEWWGSFTDWYEASDADEWLEKLLEVFKKKETPPAQTTKPAINPAIVPAIAAKAAVDTPMPKEYLPPSAIRNSISRPNASVPKKEN